MPYGPIRRRAYLASEIAELAPRFRAASRGPGERLALLGDQGE